MERDIAFYMYDLGIPQLRLDAIINYLNPLNPPSNPPIIQFRVFYPKSSKSLYF